MSGKITLDRDTFKVLAADTRVEMLKILGERKKTLSDLAKEMEMSPSTIKEHLDRLVEAGLIEALERGTKWKYYVLTRKGKSILSPVETRVWILLSTSLAALGALTFDIFNKTFFQTPKQFAGAPMAMKTSRVAEASPELVKGASRMMESDEAANQAVAAYSLVDEKMAKESEVMLSRASDLVQESAEKIVTTSTTVLESTSTTIREVLIDHMDVGPVIPSWEIFLFLLFGVVFIGTGFFIVYWRGRFKL